MLNPGPIGVFDSGYGGLTILAEFQKKLPEYDFFYLGDNARAPYGSRSYKTIYDFTRQAVEALFAKGCNLIILACNTASAKALRTIQQKDLPNISNQKRVLGVIRPTAEIIDNLSESKHIGIFGTIGTIQSGSYELEIRKLHPHIIVNSEACPMWAPLVENLEFDKPGADYFVKRHIDNILQRDPEIDTLILGCTHYPLLIDKLKQYSPQDIKLISQGKYIAESLKDYLYRHPEMNKACTKNGKTEYFTTGSTEKFSAMAEVFLGKPIAVNKMELK